MGDLLKNIFRLGVMLVVLQLWSCTEPLVPEVKKPQSLLVVEGHLSDDESANFVYLSRSQSLGTGERVPEVAACVTVIDDEGLSVNFNELTPGTYQSNQEDFIGVVGRSYILDIVTERGDHYRSAQVELKRTPPVDSIYFRVEERFTTKDEEVLSGIRILLDSHDPHNATWYYRWEFTETWEIKVSHPFDPSVYRCFDSKTASTIFITSTKAQYDDRVSALELNYISTIGFRLNSLYSILVRQYALSEQEYRYWAELKKLTESQGSLFDAQGYELRGNVFNIEDDSEFVLGYFGASSVSTRRQYIHRNQLRGLGLKYPINDCAWLSYYKEPLPPRCTDCRWHGGTLEIPEYWPN